MYVHKQHCIACIAQRRAFCPVLPASPDELLQLDADQLLRAGGPRALAGRGRRELAQRVPPLLDLRRIRGRLLPARRRLGIGAQQARTRREVLRLLR